MRLSNWVSLLPFAKFAHNSHTHSTIECAPFKALMGFTPHSLPTQFNSPLTPFISDHLNFLSCLWSSFPSYKLAPCCHRPFTITSIIQGTLCKLELPPSWKIHPIFHALLLSPYCKTSAHGPNFTWPPLDLINGDAHC